MQYKRNNSANERRKDEAKREDWSDLFTKRFFRDFLLRTLDNVNALPAQIMCGFCVTCIKVLKHVYN